MALLVSPARFNSFWVQKKIHKAEAKTTIPFYTTIYFTSEYNDTKLCSTTHFITRKREGLCHQYKKKNNYLNN